MKNSIVFPGGATDKWDESKEWINLYKKLGITETKLKQLSAVHGPRPGIFIKTKAEDLDREITLRINAIRETFEEVGVLLCKTREQLQKDSLFSNFYTKLDVKRWQMLVHNDASQFLRMCEEFEIAPDLWSSFEWSAWLTPSTFPTRFEVAFFIVVIEDMPEICAEPHEVAEIVVENPRKLMEMHRNQKLWLPPPQIYELLRLQQFNDADKLATFARDRNSSGLTLFFPISFQTKDRWVQVLPGDDLYPKDVDYHNGSLLGDNYLEVTADELRSQVKNVHRSEMESAHKWKIFMNIEPLNGHVKPASDELLNKL